jgi:hypothetical protein
MLGTGNARKGGKELKEREKGVADHVIVVSGFIALRKTTCEEMVTVNITMFRAERARRGHRSVKKGETEFSMKEEPIGVGLKVVIQEAAG